MSQSQPITTGPGPSSPTTNFGPAFAYEFDVPQHGFAELTFSFHALWVNYIYIYDVGTKFVLQERTNSNTGNAQMFNTGVNNTGKTLRYGVVSYHKLNISSGNERPGDIFYQSQLRRKNVNHPKNQETIIDLGFNDGGGDADNNAEVQVVMVTQF